MISGCPTEDRLAFYPLVVGLGPRLAFVPDLTYVGFLSISRILFFVAAAHLSLLVFPCVVLHDEIKRFIGGRRDL